MIRPALALVLRSTTCLFALALPAGAAWAAESDDGEQSIAANDIVVYGRHVGYDADSANSPTKTETDLINVPQSVTVLNRTQLDDQAVESLGEALRFVPGVVLGLGEGHRDQVTLRGQNSTADFFLDGLRDDAQYYRPLYNTERVEVLKGANAMIFGRGGGGGVINRVSKAPDFTEVLRAANISADNFGAWSLSGDVNTPISDAAALRINAAYEELASHRDVYSGHFLGLAPTLGLQLGEATKLVLAYEYGKDERVTDRGVPSLSGQPMRGQYRTFFGVKGVNNSRVEAHIARARIDHEFSDALSANLTAQFASYDKFYANVYPRAASASTVTLEGYNSATDRQNWVVQGNLVWRGETGGITHTLLGGFEATGQDTLAARHDARFGAGLATTSGALTLARHLVVPTVSFTAATRLTQSDVSVLSAYLQDQIELGEHLQIVAGIRHDRFRIETLNRINGFAAARTDSKWSPRLGVIAKPAENVSLYASYALSFLPQSGDQFAVLDAVTANLAPEKFRNIEAGLKWDFTPDLGLTAAVYQLDRTNTRATDPISGSVVLSGKSRSKGFEIALSGRLTKAWQASLGYALQDGEIRSAILSGTTVIPGGRRLAQLPRHQFSAWTRYDFSDSLGLGLGLVHQSRSFTSISNTVHLPAFTRIDAALYYKVSDALEFQLNAENLTDKRYFPSAHTDNNISTGKPRNVKLTARMKF